MKGSVRLIDEYYFQIALTIAFIVIILTLPFLNYHLTFNVRFEALSLRCFFLNLASSLVFFLVEEGKFKSLLTFSLGGAVTSLLFVRFHSTYLVLLSLALTISSVIMVSLVAYHYLSSDRTSRKQF